MLRHQYFKTILVGEEEYVKYARLRNTLLTFLTEFNHRYITHLLSALIVTDGCMDGRMNRNPCLGHSVWISSKEIS